MRPLCFAFCAFSNRGRGLLLLTVCSSASASLLCSVSHHHTVQIILPAHLGRKFDTPDHTHTHTPLLRLVHRILQRAWVHVRRASFYAAHTQCGFPCAGDAVVRHRCAPRRARACLTPGTSRRRAWECCLFHAFQCRALRTFAVFTHAVYNIFSHAIHHSHGNPAGYLYCDVHSATFLETFPVCVRKAYTLTFIPSDFLMLLTSHAR